MQSVFAVPAEMHNAPHINDKLARDKKRVVELDKLIKGLYEDEQEWLENEIAEAETSLAVFEADTGKAERFIEIVRKYTDFSELTAGMLNEYVEQILVYEAEKINHRRKQRVEVYLNFIGQFNIPIDGELAEEEPFDPIEHRREIGRNSYYRRRENRKAPRRARG